MHRTPASERTHHTFDFLHGIDLERVHLRRPRGQAPGMVPGVLLVLAVAAALVLLMRVARPLTPEAGPELSAHDSGITQVVAAREAARQVTPHDSGIELTLRAP